MGVFAALIISFTSGFVAEQLDTSIGTIEGIESFVKLPVLGIIPYLRVESEKEKSGGRRRRKESRTKSRGKITRIQSQLLIYYSTASPVLEAYKILRTNIQMDIFKGTMQNKSILISSAGPEEGKSITCINLAIAMAQAGNRVLLIDADLRRTSIYRIFGFSKESPGLTDILRKTTPIGQAIKTFSDLLMCNLGIEQTLTFPGIDNLNILLAGTLPNLPSELLSSKEIDSVLKAFKNKYDVVVIDTPPVLAVADTLILAPHVDAVILVYKVGKTAKNAIMRAKAQLEAVNAPCKGVVLNNISRQVEMRSEYYYHYKRYDQKKA
jgi:tyrosine-protein kinase Etk/Wzc